MNNYLLQLTAALLQAGLKPFLLELTGKLVQEGIFNELTEYVIMYQITKEV